MGSTAGPSLLLKVSFRAIVSAGFIWLLLVGTVVSRTPARRPTTTTTTTSMKITTVTVKPAAVIHKHEEVIGREKLVYNPELDHNFMMSKRKVPNGPDPIHNRRAGNSKRPPGRG